VLFRPTDSRRAHAGWMVGAASPGPIQAQAASVCDRGGGHISSAPEAVCIHSPDGTGCAGRWHAWDGRHWSETPTVVVAPLACPNASDLCCGVDCGTHGSCDGSSGDCVCRPPFFGPTCTLAPAYRLAGGTALAADFRGTYVHLSGLNCSGKPVYRLGGTTSEALANQIVLWQPAAAAAAAGGWMVGPGGDGAAVGNCGSTRGYLATSARGASCSSSPDGSGCVGAWREWDKDSAQWREPSAAAPVRVHALLCDIGDPCCGLDCGGHGVCHAGSCNCTHGYAGEFCDMAPGYTLSGGSQPALRGSYLRTAHRCHGKPVYQLGGEGGSILFRPAEHRVGWSATPSTPAAAPRRASSPRRPISPARLPQQRRPPAWIRCHAPWPPMTPAAPGAGERAPAASLLGGAMPPPPPPPRPSPSQPWHVPRMHRRAAEWTAERTGLAHGCWIGFTAMAMQPLTTQGWF
jgi:hypothetical protein